MRRHAVPVLLLLAAGCSSGETTTLVPGNPFASAPPAAPPPARVSLAPATLETAARVDQLGEKIVEANRQLGVRPVFRTVGSPEVSLYHRGTGEIFITEGLVRRCATDGQLAALLAYEMGRIVSEREALAAAQSRRPDREPPQEVRVGNDNAGSFGPADMTRQAELAKFEPPRRREATAPVPPPDPRTLAVACLRNAGFQPADLDAVASMLQPGAGTPALAKQFLASPPAAH